MKFLSTKILLLVCNSFGQKISKPSISWHRVHFCRRVRLVSNINRLICILACTRLNLVYNPLFMQKLLYNLLFYLSIAIKLLYAKSD